jgi:phosphate transport system substrate-binding protein
VQHIVGHDALAIYLHPNNPLAAITLEQLAEIFGDGGGISHWTDLGVEVPACQGQEITLTGRQNSSGTYAYFRDRVLNGGDFKLGMRDLRASADVELAVEQEPCAIGYGGLAHATEKVKLACVSPGTGSACVMPSIDSAADGSYPISRPLSLYTNGRPKGPLGQYIDWIKGREGQCIILKNGHAPVVRSPCKRT